MDEIPYNKLSLRLHARLEINTSAVREAQSRAPLKSLNTMMLRWSEWFQKELQPAPHDAKRRQSLGQLYV